MDTERPVPTQSGTGDPRVDEAIAGLSRLREAPLDEHPPVLEAVHDRLREILGGLGTAAPGATPPDTPRDAGRPGPARPGPARPGEHGQQGQLEQ